MENGNKTVNTLKSKSAFEKLTAYDHLLVFMGILTLLKLVSVFTYQNFSDGIHLLKLTIGLFVGFSAIFLVFKYLFDKQKTYKNVLISAFILLLVLEHDKPYLIGGLMMFTLVHVSKFFIKINKKNIFNPIVFGIAMVTIVSFFIPAIDTPPATFELLDFRFNIFNQAVPLAFVFITLSLVFNTKRVNRFPLALSFIIPALLLGLLPSMDTNQYILYALSIMFSGVIIIIEPKTSPGQTKQQIIYGIAMALLIVGLKYFSFPNPIFIGLFIGNILYAVYVFK